MIQLAKQNESRSLEQMAADAAQVNGSVVCPRCGCADFRPYKTTQGIACTVRYESCRHCGHRIVTSSVVAKRIVRDVVPHESDIEGID